MIAGSEVSQLAAQYEIASEAKETVVYTNHHGQTPKVQQGFLERVDQLFWVFTDIGNPFKEESRDLLSLDTNDIAHPRAAELIFTHHDRGRTRFVEFMDGLESEVSTFYEPIKKTPVYFSRQEPRCVDATRQKVLKYDGQLFSKMFTSCQSRECDLYDIFPHENHQFPATLSDGGKLHTCNKSHLAAVLESHVTLPDNEPHDDVFIIDGSALVDILPPRTSNTFEDYATLDVLPTIRAYSIKYERIYIVFNVYQPSSLKAEARSKRGVWSQMQRPFKLAQLLERQ